MSLLVGACALAPTSQLISQAIRNLTNDVFEHPATPNASRIIGVHDLWGMMCVAGAGFSSQRSLHNAPIFRLLLKVAVNGTHQCDFLNFCGAFEPQQHNASIAIVTMTTQVLSARFPRGVAVQAPAGDDLTYHCGSHPRAGRPNGPLICLISRNSDLAKLMCQLPRIFRMTHILAEGAIALSVTLSGGALFAS